MKSTRYPVLCKHRSSGSFGVKRKALRRRSRVSSGSLRWSCVHSGSVGRPASPRNSYRYSYITPAKVGPSDSRGARPKSFYTGQSGAGGSAPFPWWRSWLNSQGVATYPTLGSGNGRARRRTPSSMALTFKYSGHSATTRMASLRYSIATCVVDTDCPPRCSARRFGN
jgi:hypothetical protein